MRSCILHSPHRQILPKCPAAHVVPLTKVNLLHHRRQQHVRVGRLAWHLNASASNNIPVVHPEVIIPPPSKGSQYGSGDDGGNKNGGGGFGGGSSGSGSEGDSNSRARFIRSAMISFLVKLALYCAWTLGIYFVLRFIFGVFGIVGYCLGLLVGGVKGLVLRLTDDGRSATFVGVESQQPLPASGAAAERDATGMEGGSQQQLNDTAAGVEKESTGTSDVAAAAAALREKDVVGSGGASEKGVADSGGALEKDVVGSAGASEKNVGGSGGASEKESAGAAGFGQEGGGEAVAGQVPDAEGESIAERKLHPAFERRPASASDALVVYFTLLGSLLFFVCFPGL